MKKFLFLLALIPIIACAQTWIFSGNNFTNTVALDFGSGNTTKFISMGNNHNFAWSDDFTICIWHYPHTSWEAVVFSKENGPVGNGWDFRYTGANKYQFYSSGSGATRRIQIISNNTFSTGTWRHVCLVYDGSQSAAGLSIYVNGASEAFTTQFNTSTEDWSVANPFKVGAWDGLTTYTRSKVDEMTVWNDNLTSTEIGQLYNSGTVISPTSFSFWATKNISYYRMGDLTDSTSTIVDRGVNGTISGTPTAVVAGDFVSSVP